MKTGIELIAAERQRQIDKEGWTASHDDLHLKGELAMAGASYALFRGNYHYPLLHWPFEKKWFKPDQNNDIRNLVKAAALIAAEIDRLQRKNS